MAVTTQIDADNILNTAGAARVIALIKSLLPATTRVIQNKRKTHRSIKFYEIGAQAVRIVIAECVSTGIPATFFEGVRDTMMPRHPANSLVIRVPLNFSTRDAGEWAKPGTTTRPGGTVPASVAKANRKKAEAAFATSQALVNGEAKPVAPKPAKAPFNAVNGRRDNKPTRKAKTETPEMVSVQLTELTQMQELLQTLQNDVEGLLSVISDVSGYVDALITTPKKGK